MSAGLKTKRRCYFAIRKLLPQLNCSAAQSAVLTQLAGFANPDGTHIHQSFNSLAKVSKLSRRCIIDAVGAWIETGLLVQVRKGRSVNVSNEYRLEFPKDLDAVSGINNGLATESGRSTSTPGGLAQKPTSAPGARKQAQLVHQVHPTVKTYRETPSTEGGLGVDSVGSGFDVSERSGGSGGPSPSSLAEIPATKTEKATATAPPPATRLFTLEPTANSTAIVPVNRDENLIPDWIDVRQLIDYKKMVEKLGHTYRHEYVMEVLAGFHEQGYNVHRMLSEAITCRRDWFPQRKLTPEERDAHNAKVIARVFGEQTDQTAPAPAEPKTSLERARAKTAEASRRVFGRSWEAGNHSPGAVPRPPEKKYRDPIVIHVGRCEFCDDTGFEMVPGPSGGQVAKKCRCKQ